MRNYYKVLNIAETASADEIKTAYENLLKKYHPDTTVLDKEFAQNEMQLIDMAYAILSDPETRVRYNAQLFAKGNTDLPQSEEVRVKNEFQTDGDCSENATGNVSTTEIETQEASVRKISKGIILMIVIVLLLAITTISLDVYKPVSIIEVPHPTGTHTKDTALKKTDKKDAKTRNTKKLQRKNNSKRTHRNNHKTK